MSTDTVQLQRVLAVESPALRDVLDREGTRAVLLAGSQDPNAKMTVVLMDDYGPSFVIKVPTTRSAETVVLSEGHALEALSKLPLGSLSTTLPRPVGFMSYEGRTALVSTALVGVPMTVAYHSWHHTARRRNVRRDFAAASIWLDDLQTRTAGDRSQISLFGDSAERIAKRFAGHPQLSVVKRVLSSSAGRLSSHTTPRTVVHGDFWFGNLLMHGNQVNGVVDWESSLMAGEPLRDVARFAISYALYLDRHTRPGHRVHGHRGLRASDWGAGLTYMLSGRGWFSKIAQNYLTLALGRLGAPTHLWRDVVIGGIADVAATADHREFAEHHLQLLAGFVPSVRTVALVSVLRPSPPQDDLPSTGDGGAVSKVVRSAKPVVSDSSSASETKVIRSAKPVVSDSSSASETRVIRSAKPVVSDSSSASETKVFDAVKPESDDSSSANETKVFDAVKPESDDSSSANETKVFDAVKPESDDSSSANETRVVDAVKPESDDSSSANETRVVDAVKPESDDSSSANETRVVDAVKPESDDSSSANETKVFDAFKVTSTDAKAQV